MARRLTRHLADRRAWQVLVPATAFVTSAVIFRNEPRSTERALFTRINGGPEWRWLRAPQQFGTPWVLPGLALVLLVGGHRRDALIAATALPVIKAAEVATKKTLHRPRPLYTAPTVLRDDAPVEGPSFPSGHTAIATCATLLAAQHAPPPVGAALGLVVAASAYARVQQGAHHPSDTLGGVLLGWTVTAAVLLLRRPPTQRRAASRTHQIELGTSATAPGSLG